MYFSPQGGVTVTRRYEEFDFKAKLGNTVQFNVNDCVNDTGVLSEDAVVHNIREKRTAKTFCQPK